MLTDPQIITINSVAKTMPRVSTKDLSSIYQTDDEMFKLTISHIASNKRVRTMSRVDQRAIVTDPLSSENDYDYCGLYYVLDRPEVGFSIAQIQQLVTGFQTWNTSAIIAALVGKQS